MSFRNPIVGGITLIRAAIQSGNFRSGSTGWSIQQNGNAELNQVTVRGTFMGTDYEQNTKGLFWYSPTPGPGNLVAWWALTAGEDEYTNNYAAGLNIKDANGNTLRLSDAELSVDTGNPSIALKQFLGAFSNGTGDAQTDTLEITGSRNSSNNDNAGILLTSSSNDLTKLASAQLFYAQPSIPGGQSTYLEMYYGGIGLFGAAIQAVQPGTGTSPSDAAVSETWHPMTLQNPTVFGQPPAPFAPPRYRLECEGGGKTVRLSGAVKLLTASGASEAFWNPPTGYAPTYGQHLTVATKTAAGTNGQNVINCTNGTPDSQLLINTMAAGDIFYLDGITYVTD